MKIVPAVRVTIQPRSLAGAIDDEFARQGSPLPLPALELLTALSWVETGGHVTNYNFGNEMAASFDRNGVEHTTWTGNAWRPPWFDAPTEATPAKYVDLHNRMYGRPPAKDGKPDVPSAYRAFDTPEAGLTNHVRVLRTEFPAMVQAASTGDPAAFRLAIVTPDPTTKRRYSPDYTSQHVTTFRALVDQFRAQKVFEGLARHGANLVAPLFLVAGLFAAWKLFA